MSFSKEEIYNIALSHLLLSQQVINVDTDKSNAVSVLNTFWNIAFQSTLQDLDLDSLSEPITLELLYTFGVDDNNAWTYVYKYPSRCVFLRRINSGVVTDNRNTHISKRVALYEDQKAIYTNEYQAVAECITKDFSLDNLSPMAALAIGLKLATLASPLIVGKGAKDLENRLQAKYTLAKTDAQRTDALENFVYEPEWQRSEFVYERLS